VTVAVIESKNCTRGDAAPSEVYKVVEMSRHLSIFDNSVQSQASKRTFINSIACLVLTPEETSLHHHSHVDPNHPICSRYSVGYEMD
jgi:hypothetical protein